MRIVIALAMSLLILSSGAIAGDSQADLLGKRLQHFSASGSIYDVVSSLAFSAKCFMALESVESTDAKPGVEAPTVAVSVNDKTVKEILDAVVAQDKRYGYVVSDDWINMVPASVVDDPDYIYNMHIPGEVVESTDSAKRTSISAWMREHNAGSLLFGTGDMKRKLPVEPQTVTLTNPTLRDVTNWHMKLAGKDRWSACTEHTPSGRTRIIFTYSVLYH